MTAYATQADLEGIIGKTELLQIAGMGETRTDRMVDAEKVTAALTDASDLINSYLGMRYELPVAADAVAARRLLKRFTAAIARYYLRNKNEGGGDVADFVERHYKDVLAELKSYRDGKATLEGLTEKTARPSGSVLSAGGKPIFGTGGSGLDFYHRGGFR